MSRFIAPTFKIEKTAWVFNDAQVCGNANVYGLAQVWDNAMVSGNARVFGYARVGINAILEGDVTITRGWIRNIHWWKDIP